jgi:hypothetical protein
MALPLYTPSVLLGKKAAMERVACSIDLNALSTDELIAESARLVEEIQALADRAEALCTAHQAIAIELAHRDNAPN